MAESCVENLMDMTGFKVLTAEERQKIVTQIQAYEASVYFKYQTTGVYKTNAVQSGSKRMITCKRPASLPLELSGRPVTLNVVLNSEIYFLVTTVAIEQRNIHFNVDTDIFHLARRKDRRVRFPKDYDATFMVKRLNDQMSFLRALVLDLSTGGCRLALNTDVPFVTMDATIEGALKIGGRHPIEVKGLVKYHRLYVRKEHKQVFGIQFVEVTSFVEAKLQAVVLDLQREFFLRALE